jgi:hypothetical protein
MVRKTLKNIVFILTLRCDQASRLISYSQEAPLNKAERWALSFHLLICRMCRKYKKHLKLMRDILNRLAENRLYEIVTPSLFTKEQAREFRGRISKKIREKLDSM